jgi:hypothetical protein
MIETSLGCGSERNFAASDSRDASFRYWDVSGGNLATLETIA